MMRKRRKDSTWDRLTSEQRAKLEKWLFEGNLSYAEAVARAHKESRSSRSSILERLQSRGQRRKTTLEMARERPKLKPCEERTPTRLDDGAVGVRRPEAEGGDRVALPMPAPRSRENRKMFAYVRLCSLNGKKNIEGAAHGPARYAVSISLRTGLFRTLAALFPGQGQIKRR
jgi:hypothetical protein